ncbi:MAG: DNA polymerase III subunit beta, partial [Nitrospinaceae bacterium]|nr:DNA polymerase III subunit beta [Nitrospinaceae bacterium]NIR57523.1 DNA polymerase III subunit beta [Nitrospinaceae bacterium]NIS87998.1 DNA polymerase III subunit beta [Nitrospinaceae bacterium]NIT84857.1 DNA polymerase III subunit beta [Nitrospinaceae bacterium]NIU47038.1 DNA polymerase III subunit beta [Nitrospinaceae bacterium]
SHLLMSTEKDGICIQATDLEIGTKGFYPANVIRQGTVTLNARKLYDILRELPDQEVHLVKEENEWVSLKCGNSKFRLPGLPASDFPPLPDYSEDTLMEFSASQLKEMIRKTFFAVSPDETRQALNGLLLERENGRANMVGTDGHRMALIKRSLLKNHLPETEKQSFLLPKKALSELLKLMEDEEATFAFSAKNNHLAFIQGKQVIVARRIDGKFPNYRQVIPSDNNLIIKVDRNECIHALKRVALLADEKSKMVRFEVTKGNLTLISDTTDQGAAREELPVTYDGEDVCIGLNAKYLLDVLNVVDDENISINLKDQNHSCLITVDNDKDYLSIVMP